MATELKTVEPASKFLCKICFKNVPADNKFSNNGRCKHNFCSNCIAKYVNTKVVKSSEANIRCPDLKCKLPLDPLSCRPILPNHLFDKWSELLCSETIFLKYDLSKRFYCPYPDCSALILNECNDKPTKCTCPDCKRNFCFRCRSPWHGGFWCRKRQGSPNGVLFEKLMKRNKWTRCPNCGHAVLRIDGCRRIKCRCGQSFCYGCGEAITAPCQCFGEVQPDDAAFVIVVVIVCLLPFVCLKMY